MSLLRRDDIEARNKELLRHHVHPDFLLLQRSRHGGRQDRRINHGAFPAKLLEPQRPAQENRSIFG